MIRHNRMGNVPDFLPKSSTHAWCHGRWGGPGRFCSTLAVPEVATDDVERVCGFHGGCNAWTMFYIKYDYDLE